MPNYYFECEECGLEKDFYKPIEEGPPKDVSCPICIEVDENIKMNHVLGGAFILKGDGWPGKEFKSRD